MEILNENHFFFCDVETTGFDPIRNDVVSLSMIVTDPDFNPVGEFYETCRPDFNKFYSSGAEKAHGFTRAQSEKFQDPRKMLIRLLKFLAPFRTPGKYHPYIYHALKYFDFRFTDWAFRKQNMQWSFYKMFDERFTESTILMARNAGYSPNKLSDWAERVEFDLQHHNALSDTRCCVEVYKFLRKSSWEIEKQP